MTTPRSVLETRTHTTWRETTRPSDRPRYVLTAGLVAFDTISVGIAFVLAFLIRFRAGIPFLEMPPYDMAFYMLLALWAVPVWLGIFALYRLYDWHNLFAGFQEYTRSINACTSGTMVMVLISFLDTTIFISRGWLLMLWALSIIFVCSSRFATRRLLRRLRSRGILATPTLIVGANEEGKALAEQFLGDPGSGARIIGFVDSSAAPGTRVVDGLTVLGDLQDLEQIVQDCSAREIVVATTALNRGDLLDLYRTLGHSDTVEIRLSSGLFEILTTGVQVQEISCVPLMTPQRVRITGIDATVKAMLDYVGASVGLIALSPILLTVALLVKLDSSGPILHRRRVLGRSGKPFEALKFRTMVANADELLAADVQLREVFEARFKLKADPRVTRIGRVLRRTSLDELPQLINVIRGEMSLVGPRMIAPEEAGFYGKWKLNLLTVKPGMTGPWQVHGRSDIPYDERVRLSMQYIRNYSIWLDLEILLRTVSVVLRGSGAY